ncbi:unnamed protein product [Musa hybrid cultivar]
MSTSCSASLLSMVLLMFPFSSSSYPHTENFFRTVSSETSKLRCPLTISSNTIPKLYTSDLM